VSRPIGAAAKPVRRAKTTVLIVGEGSAEVAFLQHLRVTFLGSRDAGLSLKVINARGKGGAHVLRVAMRSRNNAAFDRVAALLDTDADWGPLQRRKAKDAGVTVFESNTCLEIELLAIAGVKAADGAKDAKARFEAHFKYPAHEAAVYTARFDAAVLMATRNRSDWLDAILRYIGI
jgi:hypothetical protein